MKNELKHRAVKAASMFLERRGLEIIETEWSCELGGIDIVAKDDDALVFTCVTCRDAAESGLPKDDISDDRREKLERIAAKFLETFEGIDVVIRFDLISMLVLGTDRAFIRHHINAFGVGA